MSSAGGAADDGAVETALWRDEVSVEAVFVVLEDPLPLDAKIRLAPRVDRDYYGQGRGPPPTAHHCPMKKSNQETVAFRGLTEGETAMRVPQS